MQVTQCVHYEGRKRCENDATVHLFAPDGKPNPGGRLCQQHANLCIVEYREKLAEEWTAKPIDEWGDLIGGENGEGKQE